MRLRKLIAALEERVAELEGQQPAEPKQLPAATIPTIPTVDLDAQALWREHIADYSAYCDTDEWAGYL